MEHSNSKKKDYCIVKEEPNQDGGYTLFRYAFPGMMPRDPSAVGLYTSPMHNPPISSSLIPTSMSSVEIARSIGQIKHKPTRTLSGRLLGSPYPGTVTIPNRPFVAVAPGLMSPCGSPCNMRKPTCDSENGAKVGVIGPRNPCHSIGGPMLVGPFRKGNPTPGVWPLFHLPTYGVNATDIGTMVLIVEDKRYKVTLPYGKITTINDILSKYSTVSSPYGFRYGMLVTSVRNPFSWHGRVSYDNIDALVDVFNELSGDDSVKFEHESTGKEISKEDVKKEIKAYIEKLKASKKEKQEKETDEQKKKTEEAVKKLEESEAKLEKGMVKEMKKEDTTSKELTDAAARIAALEKELAELKEKK